MGIPLFWDALVALEDMSPCPLCSSFHQLVWGILLGSSSGRAYSNVSEAKRDSNCLNYLHISLLIYCINLYIPLYSQLLSLSHPRISPSHLIKKQTFPLNSASNFTSDDPLSPFEHPKFFIFEVNFPVFSVFLNILLYNFQLNQCLT